MPYAELKGLLTDIGTSCSEMFHTAGMPDKPCVAGLWVHSIKTMDKLGKYDRNVDTVTKGKTERVINLFIA